MRNPVGTTCRHHHSTGPRLWVRFSMKGALGMWSVCDHSWIRLCCLTCRTCPGAHAVSTKFIMCVACAIICHGAIGWVLHLNVALGRSVGLVCIMMRGVRVELLHPARSHVLLFLSFVEQSQASWRLLGSRISKPHLCVRCQWIVVSVTGIKIGRRNFCNVYSLTRLL